MIKSTPYTWQKVAKDITPQSSPDLIYLKKQRGICIENLSQVQHDKKQLGKLGKPKDEQEILDRKMQADWLQERETIALEDLKAAEGHLEWELRFSDAFDMSKYPSAEINEGVVGG